MILETIYINLETVDGIDRFASFNKTMLLKLKSIKYVEQFRNAGYTVNDIAGTASAIPTIENMKHRGVFVVIHNARNVRYYVQRVFTTVDDAERYIQTRDKFQLMVDTSMKHRPPDNTVNKS